MKRTMMTTLAVMLGLGLTGSASASSITVDNPAAYKGKDLTFTFRKAPSTWLTCYDYRTADGWVPRLHRHRCLGLYWGDCSFNEGW